MNHHDLNYGQIWGDRIYKVCPCRFIVNDIHGIMFSKKLSISCIVGRNGPSAFQHRSSIIQNDETDRSVIPLIIRETPRVGFTPRMISTITE